jgi:hypothetical protein
MREFIEGIAAAIEKSTKGVNTKIVKYTVAIIVIIAGTAAFIWGMIYTSFWQMVYSVQTGFNWDETERKISERLDKWGKKE